MCSFFFACSCYDIEGYVEFFLTDNFDCLFLKSIDTKKAALLKLLSCGMDGL